MTGVALDSLPSEADVDIVIPVFNEQRALEASVRKLHACVQAPFPFTTTITIADNASTDGTWAIATRLEAELEGVRAVHLDQKGRGRALAQAWLASEASVVAYMDVDLSTDLDALLPLVAPLISGHSDLSIGSRLAPGASVVRGPRRELISRGYNLLLRLALGVGFRDAQCGFKAMRSEVARALLPAVENRAWFFDTELLVLAERAGLRIHELPVDWTDDPDSRVDVFATALEDLRGIIRVSRRLAAGWSLEGLQGLRRAAPRSAGLGQLLRFGVIGLFSTASYVAVYWLLREFWSAPIANAVALVLTGLANTAANRRLTFGVRGRQALARDHIGGLAALGIALLTTSGAIAGLHALAPHAGRLAELVVLSVANLVATITRFLLLRAWIHHPRQGHARRPQLLRRKVD
ncbi:MAG: bifunctional glycosyltransferase family 2/GtrA family protein [Candidatus Dormibacteraeota bacterium]|nr:bifunctional glycosyltransferase family 2/GtrA family protein [Candidatus Dormibacteraeota bacterium]